MSILPEEQIRPFGDAKTFVRAVRGFTDETRSRVGFSYPAIRAAAESAGLGRVPFADPTAANQEQLLVAVSAAVATLVEDTEGLRKDLDRTRTYDGSALEVVQRECKDGEPTLLLKVGPGTLVDACIEANGRFIPLVLATGAAGSVPVFIGAPGRDNPPAAKHAMDSLCGLPLPERAGGPAYEGIPSWNVGVYLTGANPHDNILLLRKRDLARCGVLLVDTKEGVLVYGVGPGNSTVRAHLYRRLGTVDIPPPSSWREAPLNPDEPIVYAYRWGGG